MSAIHVLCLDDIDSTITDPLRAFIAHSFGLDTEVRRGDLDLGLHFDPRRKQYESTAILRAVLEQWSDSVQRCLALTERDLFIPMLSFLFGHAQVGGPVALVSLARLRQEFYGFPPAPALLQNRLRKEAAHELGHAFGLQHCSDPNCCMSLSTTIEYVDRKQSEFCESCRAMLRESLAAERARLTRLDNEEVSS